MGRQHQVLTDRVNSEPPILRGSSSTELLMLVVVSTAVWVPLSILIGLLIGSLFTAVGFIGAGVLASVFFGSTWLQKVKLNRPDGYYQIRLITFLHDQKIKRSPFIRRTGHWDVRRTK